MSTSDAPGGPRPVVGVTMGDPAGIGPEIIVSAWPSLLEDARPVVIGDADVVRAAVEACDADLAVRAVDAVVDARHEADAVDVLDLDNVAAVERGVVRADYGAASLEYVTRAADLAMAGEIDAMATAPIHKQAIRAAGSDHTGHTGLLADRTGTDAYAMVLIEGDLRVAHVSTHCPLREACDLVTTERVDRTVDVAVDAMRDLGIDAPTVAVAGLNPHASDGGLLGDAESEEIEPAVERARERGLDVHGPASPDTVFVEAAAGDYDCVVAMYHDQGHIPVKMLGFGSAGVTGVNMTAGLPIVRTSVDHGTAFDIAGEGVASDASLRDAVAIAARVARNRRDRQSERPARG